MTPNLFSCINFIQGNACFSENIYCGFITLELLLCNTGKYAVNNHKNADWTTCVYPFCDTIIKNDPSNKWSYLLLILEAISLFPPFSS